MVIRYLVKANFMDFKSVKGLLPMHYLNQSDQNGRASARYIDIGVYFYFASNCSLDPTHVFNQWRFETFQSPKFLSFRFNMPSLNFFFTCLWKKCLFLHSL